MATIGPVMSRAESDALMNRLEHHFDTYGFGPWCVEFAGEPIGWTGLMVPWFRSDIEIGWRIAADRWGHGFAPEAATAVLDHVFGGLGFEEVVSFTAASNTKSRRVMEKIGMIWCPDEGFGHPGVPPDSPLHEHVLYRMTAAEWNRRGDLAPDTVHDRDDV